jgi:ParB family chromosome partitioning protein
MNLKYIPLEHLKVSRLNMRHGRKSPDIADLLPSIRESGVRQSLLVRKEGKHYGVIAGRRRYFALKQVDKEIGKPIKAPCGILQSGKDAYLADGWADVVLLERGTYFYSWDYRSTSKDEGGQVFVERQHDGCVTFHEGYLTEKDARKREAGAGDSPTPNIKPELSKPMADYVAHHRQAMVRANLLGQGGLVLRLIAAHLIVGSPLWQAEPQSRARLKPETRASLESAPSETQFEDAKVRALALAGFDDKRSNLIRQNGDDWELAKLFLHLQTLEDKDVVDILTVAMGETLAAG